MPVETVRLHLARYGRAESVVVLDGSSATVELAAQAIGVENARIAKTISVYDQDEGRAILVVVAGDARLAGGPFKRRFGHKPRMVRPEDVEQLTGHAPGGVCPFANPEGTEVWLDESLRRFDDVWPAAGDARSAIRLTLGELEQFSGAKGWVDVTNGWRLSGV
ncbi:MAG TPA: YbaK/EbsC family protein [Acidimicrobiales bacterium]|jgi:prolyl-tRNA editing enzyme YbaK/EbsC (Cys-tRNA(Pro) deacylase)|nr:YbaK/EbsC family protein [Acidimicrobiales bacterium]